MRKAFTNPTYFNETGRCRKHDVLHCGRCQTKAVIREGGLKIDWPASVKASRQTKQ